MKSLILSILSIFSVAGSLIAPVERELWPAPEPVEFEVNGRPAAYQPRVEACNKAVETFTDQYTDHWYEAMEECVYLDPDYLTAVGEAE